MPAIGSILQVTPATYVNPYNYVLTGTTTAFTATTITLDGGSNTNDAYNGWALCYVNQANPGINRVITDYDGTTKIATLDGTWTDHGGAPPVVGTTIWAVSNLYPVDRRFQWIKDGVDIAGAVGGSFTPYTAGSYQVRETAFYPNTSGLTTSTTSSAATITGTRDAALVYADNLVWQGCFYAPATSPDEMAYGGVCAYNAAGNGGAGSLFVRALSQKVGEISIPTPGTTLGTVPTATLLNTATLVDPLEGQRSTSGITTGGGRVISGLLVDDGKLIVTAHGDYTYNPSSWFWRRPLNLSTTGAVEGPFSVTDPAFNDNQRIYAGYMASVPAALQTKLGGPVIAGLAAQSIVSAASDGPAYSSFDPANFTAAAANVKRGTFVAATANTMDLSSGPSMSGVNDFYVGYWLTNDSGTTGRRRVIGYNGTSKVATVDSNWDATPSSGNWVLIPQINGKALTVYADGQLQPSELYSYVWDWTSSPIGGYAVPNGTRSVLAFGQGGNNYYMYSSPSQFRGGVQCYDPVGGGTGEHNYPYYTRCWAYDANDLEQARLGNVTPGSVKPYAVWNFTMPVLNGGAGVGGAAYDPVNKRLFLTNISGPFGRIVIHVYTVTNATYP